MGKWIEFGESLVDLNRVGLAKGIGRKKNENGQDKKNGKEIAKMRK